MATGGPGVSVLAPNGRRQTVKVTARTTLLQVLEDVCKKQNFNPSEYDLKFQRTVLDLSLQWRFANLPNNAKLEMVGCSQQRAGAESTKVRVAFQLEDGMRLQHEFLCSQTLWDVISQFSESRSCLEQGPSEHYPVCIYMRDEVKGQSALKQTSLQSLGITGGSVIIRFLMKCDQPEKAVDICAQKQMAREKDTVFKDTVSSTYIEPKENKPIISGEEKCSSKKFSKSESAAETVDVERGAEASVSYCSSITNGSDRPQVSYSSDMSDKQYPSCSSSSQSLPHTWDTTFIPFQGGGHRLGGANLPTGLPESDVPCDTAQESFRSPGPSKPKKSKTDEEGGCQPIDRQPLVCHLDLEENLNFGSREPTDDFFEVTVDDVRRRFSELKSERQKLEESPLLTKALREAQLKEKLERYPKVVLRVLFPDRYILQGFFRTTETVGAVKEFVHSHLEDSQLPFYLFTTPPRIELKDDSQTLFQADLFPAAVVHFGSQIQRDHYLCQEFLQATMPPSQADLLVARMMPCSPVAPILENVATGLKPEEAYQAVEISDENEEHQALNDRQERDLGKVPKWLKLPALDNSPK
ncbi:tether containing UBX domain for GLUT4 [Pelodytes ibericus]